MVLVRELGGLPVPVLIIMSRKNTSVCTHLYIFRFNDSKYSILLALMNSDLLLESNRPWYRENPGLLRNCVEKFFRGSNKFGVTSVAKCDSLACISTTQSNTQ